MLTSSWEESFITMERQAEDMKQPVELVGWIEEGDMSSVEAVWQGEIKRYL